MSERSPWERFVEALKILYDKACSEHLAYEEAIQAIEAFADAVCDEPTGHDHGACRAALLRECGLVP